MGQNEGEGSPTWGLDAAGQPGAEMSTLGCPHELPLPPPLPLPTAAPHPQSTATHQQRQRDGHEHRTASHAGQAYEVQGPPAGSLHHKQLWAQSASVPPLLVPL